MARERQTYGVKLVRGPVVNPPRHPDALENASKLASWCGDRAERRPLAADLFCGAGGLSVGLTDAGYDVVVGVDHDDLALETYASLHPGLTLHRDLSSADAVDEVAELLTSIDIALIAGGPPCQPFSKAGASKIRSLIDAGSRAAHDHRRDLWESFLEIVLRVQPPAVLLENVPDMAIGADTSIVRTIVDELETHGYGVHTSLLHAWEHGVPQHRQRFILVGLAGGRDLAWPTPNDRVVTVGNAIRDLPGVEGGWRPDGGADGFQQYVRPSDATAFMRRARRGLRGHAAKRVHDHITRPVREDDRVIFASMDTTTRYSDLDESLKRYRDDIFDDKYKRLGWDELSRSITAHIARDGYWYIHPEQLRTLTIREAARLQTFPDRVRFAGPPSAAFRQIGNAVPPLLAERMGIAIQSSMRSQRPVPRATSEIARKLVTWFESKDALRVPWLESTTAWSAVVAQLLLQRAPAAVAESHWQAIQKLDTPKRTLESKDEVRRIAVALKHPERAQVVVKAARWLERDTDGLRSVEALVRVPNVGSKVASTAALVDPSMGPTPVIVNDATLRVAARVSGAPVDARRKGSDGRLAITRLIGSANVAGLDESRVAMAAVIELAADVCTRTPKCRLCPIRGLCATGDAASPALFD